MHDINVGRYAGFWIRFLGDFLDGIFLLALVAPVYLIVDWGLLGLQSAIFTHDGEDLGVSGVLFVIIFLYNTTYLVSRTGKSWARRKLGIAVVDADGKPVGFFRNLGRNLFAAFVSSIFYLGFLWMIWDPRKQAWHDKVFRTFVVYDPML